MHTKVFYLFTSISKAWRDFPFIDVVVTLPHGLGWDWLYTHPKSLQNSHALGRPSGEGMAALARPVGEEEGLMFEVCFRMFNNQFSTLNVQMGEDFFFLSPSPQVQRNVALWLTLLIAVMKVIAQYNACSVLLYRPVK
jgi:hypothetical protein